MMNFYRLLRPRSSHRAVHGFTLTEALVTVVVLGILTAIAAPTIPFGNAPLKDTSSRLVGNLKLMRAKAMSHTAAYRLRAVPGTTGVVDFRVERAALCSDTAWTADPGFSVEDAQVDRPVQVSQVMLNGQGQPIDNWSLCYSSRGLASHNLEMTLRDEQSGQKITVFPGGAIDVQAIP